MAKTNNFIQQLKNDVKKLHEEDSQLFGVFITVYTPHEAGSNYTHVGINSLILAPDYSVCELSKDIEHDVLEDVFTSAWGEDNEDFPKELLTPNDERYPALKYHSSDFQVSERVKKNSSEYEFVQAIGENTRLIIYYDGTINSYDYTSEW